MAKVEPYHATSLEYPPRHREVYHDHDDCPYGKEIRVWHKAKGTNKKPRCDECIHLD